MAVRVPADRRIHSTVAVYSRWLCYFRTSWYARVVLKACDVGVDGNRTSDSCGDPDLSPLQAVFLPADQLGVLAVHRSANATPRCDLWSRDCSRVPFPPRLRRVSGDGIGRGVFPRADCRARVETRIRART